MRFGNGSGQATYNATSTIIEPYSAIGQSAGYMPDSVFGSSPIQKVLRPISLWSSLTGYRGCYGEFDGVYFVGGEGLSPEDIITIAGTNYLVWNNVAQATRLMFCAIRLD
jgi:hypothetical protein